MFRVRLVPIVVIGSLMMGIAFAGAKSDIPAPAENLLGKDAVLAIEQSCAAGPGQSETSEAFRKCVKSGEDEAVAEAGQGK